MASAGLALAPPTAAPLTGNAVHRRQSSTARCSECRSADTAPSSAGDPRPSAISAGDPLRARDGRSVRDMPEPVSQPVLARCRYWAACATPTPGADRLFALAPSASPPHSSCAVACGVGRACGTPSFFASRLLYVVPGWLRTICLTCPFLSSLAVPSLPFAPSRRPPPVRESLAALSSLSRSRRVFVRLTCFVVRRRRRPRLPHCIFIYFPVFRGTSLSRRNRHRTELPLAPPTALFFLATSASQ